jgi:diguanylate cyclase (GGDEF)-like protein
MRIHWRQILAPAITLTTVVMILLFDRYLFRVPNPGAISFLAVAFSAYLGGIGAGLVSAAISVGFAAIHFSPPGGLFHYSSDNLQRMLVLVVCTPAIAIMMGELQRRAARALERELSVNRELRPLRSALDQADEVGILLLDSELCVQFVNHAFRRLWHLPDGLAESKPAFATLLHHARDARIYAIPDDRLDAYVADREARVRAGDERPVDIRLANGKVVRSRCKKLADGGRMLTYGNVSDLVQTADELAELATRDSLTGTYNRRHFASALDAEWNRYRRYQRPLSLLVLDIDHFKSINDTYGHDVGDQVIIHFARSCESQIRASDVLARIGGEEFALILPETHIREACTAAERLRSTVNRRTASTRGGELTITVSIGAAEATPDMIDPAQLLKRADEALYAAKRGGRNRVECARDTTPTLLQMCAEVPPKS